MTCIELRNKIGGHRGHAATSCLFCRVNALVAAVMRAVRPFFYDPVVAVSVSLLIGLGAGLWGGATIGRRAQLSLLSQQRAWQIMVAVHHKCDDKFVTPLEGGPFGLIELAGARCSAVSDTALEAMYRAGVSPVDEVLEAAKDLARQKEREQ